jgi:hypothetical protein
MRSAALIGAALVACALLASCAPPSTPTADPTTHSASDTPVPNPSANGGDSGWAACDDATVDALTASLDGTLTLGVDDPGSYPPYLAAPSCIAIPTGQGISTAFFVGATESDFEAMEATVVAAQGPGTAVRDIAAPLQAAETWESGGVIDLRFFDTANGVSAPYIQATSVLADYTVAG